MNKKFAPFLFAAIMAVSMGFMMSLFITLVNKGLGDGFLLWWIRSFGVSVVIAFPTSMIIAPIAQKIVGIVVKE